MTSESDQKIKEFAKRAMAVGKYLIIPMGMVELIGYNATALLQYLIYKEQYFETREELTEEGYFYNTIGDIESGTCLSRKKQDLALEKLEECGIIHTKLAGMPARKHFKINYINIADQFDPNRQTCLPQTDKHVCRKQTTTIKRILIKKPNICASHITTGLQPVLVKKVLIKKQPLVTKIADKREIYRNDLREKFDADKAQKEEQRKKKLQRNISHEMQVIIDYWISKGMSFHKEETKSFARSIDTLQLLLNGKLFNSFKDKTNHNRNFSIDEIKRSIDNFVLSAYNLDYEPKSPQRKKFFQSIRFVDFFYNTYPSAKEEDKSFFLKSLLSKPALIANSKIFATKDLYPNATKILVDWYKRTFGNRDDNNFSLKRRNDIIYATHELKSFYDKNKDRINLKDWSVTYNQTDPVSFLAVQCTRALDKMLRDNESFFISFTTGWMKSEKMMEERLPSFLQKENIMK